MFKPIVLAASLLVVSAPVFAQAGKAAPAPAAPSSRGTPQDELACKDDALLLCPNVIGNDMAVLACFKQQREKLSPACTGVLKKYGQL